MCAFSARTAFLFQLSFGLGGVIPAEVLARTEIEIATGV
jgi:hypothetical protein